jgi:hypothetical protein
MSAHGAQSHAEGKPRLRRGVVALALQAPADQLAAWRAHAAQAGQSTTQGRTGRSWFSNDRGEGGKKAFRVADSSTSPHHEGLHNPSQHCRKPRPSAPSLLACNGHSIGTLRLQESASADRPPDMQGTSPLQQVHSRR